MQFNQSDDVLDTSPVNVSMEAAIELEELNRGVRKDAPAFSALVGLLLKPTEGFGTEGMSMLSDIRSFGLFKESLGQIKPTMKIHDHAELAKSVAQVFASLIAGIDSRDEASIAMAKRFCLAFNSNLLAQEMSDIYSQRENSDARYISHESIP